MSRIIYRKDREAKAAKSEVSYRDAKQEYIERNGYHFSEKLCEFAVGRMEALSEGVKKPIEPYTKGQTESLLMSNGVSIDNLHGYDHVFVINMGKADYLNSSIANISLLARYVKDVLDDPDGYEGIAFVRWLADIEHTGVQVDWDSM